MRIDPIKNGFYCVDYIYMNKEQSAVYFELLSAQEALVKMIKNGVDCKGIREWKPKVQIMSITKF